MQKTPASRRGFLVDRDRWCVPPWSRTLTGIDEKPPALHARGLSGLVEGAASDPGIDVCFGLVGAEAVLALHHRNEVFGFLHAAGFLAGDLVPLRVDVTGKDFRRGGGVDRIRLCIGHENLLKSFLSTLE